MSLKESIVEYVGMKLNQEEVNVSMIVEVLSEEFPELLQVVYLQGYSNAIDGIKNFDGDLENFLNENELHQEQAER